MTVQNMPAMTPSANPSPVASDLGQPDSPDAEPEPPPDKDGDYTPLVLVALGPPQRLPGGRWVGTLYCRNAACQYVLAEVFADPGNDTYLAVIGGEPVRFMSIPCPRCRRIRKFETMHVLPVGVLPSSVPVVTPSK